MPHYECDSHSGGRTTVLLLPPLYYLYLLLLWLKYFYFIVLLFPVENKNSVDVIEYTKIATNLIFFLTGLRHVKNNNNMCVKNTRLLNMHCSHLMHDVNSKKSTDQLSTKTSPKPILVLRQTGRKKVEVFKFQKSSTAFIQTPFPRFLDD